MTEPRSFSIKVGEDVLADLRARLDRVRWPDEAPGAGWEQGTDLAYMQHLVRYWRERYDWRTHEARLNRLRQFTVALGGIDLHFIHEPGRGPAPMPLLISHGWPGSIAEFERIIPMLTDPAAFGADPADAFTVVAPSLPGYGFYWFVLPEWADAPRWHDVLPEPVPEFTTLVMRDSWNSLTTGREARELATSVLPNFIAKQRWFAAKDDHISRADATMLGTLARRQLGDYLLLMATLELDRLDPRIAHATLRHELGTEAGAEALDAVGLVNTTIAIEGVVAGVLGERAQVLGAIALVVSEADRAFPTRLAAEAT